MHGFSRHTTELSRFEWTKKCPKCLCDTWPTHSYRIGDIELLVGSPWSLVVVNEGKDCEESLARIFSTTGDASSQRQKLPLPLIPVLALMVTAHQRSDRIEFLTSAMEGLMALFEEKNEQT